MDKLQVSGDDSEIKSSIPAFLEEWGIQVSIENMDGKGYDYCWESLRGHLAVLQRKTWMDFLNSIADGRLIDDAKKCSEMEEAYLALEGIAIQDKNGLAVASHISSWKDDRWIVLTHHREWSYSSIAGMLMSISPYFTGIIPTTDAYMTARFIQTALSHKGNGIPKKFRRKFTFNIDPKVEKFMNIPNIGYELASRLAGKYTSIHTLAVASTSELEEVEGIGKQTANHIWRYLNE